MPNPYVNKVVRSNGATLIDISDTTAVAADVTSGKYFYLASGQKVAGAKASAVLAQKSITLNGSYSAQDDSADGYSAVTVNVQGGASMSEVQNTYGTEVVITSAPGSAPSATRHTLYFEYEDESTETVYAYYDDALIGTAITATTPTTHSSKTVTLAQLDGTTWYSYAPSQWTTVYDGTISISNREFSITSVTDGFTVGDVYRITIDNTQFTGTVYHDSTFDTNMVGNTSIIVDWASTGDPVVLYNIAGYISGNSYLSDGSHTFKLEKQN